ncbi:MAG: hypothetical protein JWO67_1958 [Streptosporangiaceae bacterium]|nr:hypothetical protein [Streptosporangiaceae bacterium]
MPKQLTTQNATITTAAVEVKTLTISGKQVTLAVFRQLPEHPLIAEDGTLNGVTWGHVNYHPDKCGDAPAHWHIVWQHGAELLRARVEHDPFAHGGAEYAFRCPTADKLLTACVRESLRTGYVDNPLDNPLIRTGRAGEYRRRHPRENERHIPGTGSVPVLATASAAAVAAHREEENIFPRGPFKSGTAKAVLDAEVDGYGASLNQLQADLQVAVAAEADRRQRHRDVRTALAELPQLFIAV